MLGAMPGKDDMSENQITEQVFQNRDSLRMSRADFDSYITQERERIADLWAGCPTEAEGHGQVDVGASIRAGRLVDA
jgi:hypothetical protein